MSSPRRPLLARIAIGLAVALALLALVEGGLRVFLGPPPPPVRVYTVLAPGAGALVEEDGKVRATYVAVDPPPIVPAKPTGPRWVAVGASSVHGGSMGVFRDGEFPAVAGARAGVEVLNYATPGLDSYDLVNLVGQLGIVHPRGVIFYEGHNDVGNAWFQQRFGTPEAVAEARLGALFGRSRLFVELRRGLGPVEGQARSRGGPATLGGMLTPEARARAEAYFTVNLRRIAWRCAEEGWKLVLVTPVSNVLAEPTRLKDGENDAAHAAWVEGSVLRARDPAGAVAAFRRARDIDVVGIRASTAVQEAVRQVAAETGATLVDAERELPREPGLDVPASAMFAPGDPLHLSPEGHAALGALVGEAIRAAER